LNFQDVQKHSVHTLVFRSLKRTHDMFLSDQGNAPMKLDENEKLRCQIKIADEYGPVKEAAKREAKAKQMHHAGGDISNGIAGGKSLYNGFCT
ncbi:unnamed protein product, partial [Lymnaea stagnalis]